MSGSNYEYNNKPSFNHNREGYHNSNNWNNDGNYGDYYNDNSQRHRNGSNMNFSSRRGNSRAYPSAVQGYQQTSPRPTNNFDDQDHRNGYRYSYRPTPYDNRTRQNTKSHNFRFGSSTHEERENPHPSSSRASDNILAGWDESPSDNWAIRDQTSNSSKEGTKPSTENTKANDDDEIDWITSDQPTPSNSVAFRALSPPLYDYFLDEVNNKKVNNNKEKFKAKQDQYYDEESQNNGEDDYKGKSFLPPYPIVPVSSDFEQSTYSDIGRIFENDSRSSAQSFDNLSRLARSLWNVRTDVPLDLASKQDVNPEEYLKLNGEKLRETSVEPANKILIEPEWPEWPEENTRPYNPELTDNQSSSFTSNQSSSFTNNQSSSFTDDRPFSFTDDRSSSFTESRSTYLKYAAYESNAFALKTFRSFLQSEKSERKINIARNSCNVNAVEVSIKYSKLTSTVITSTKHEEGTFRRMVDSIYNSSSDLWLESAMSHAHILIPKISSFDAQTIHNLLKILSSPFILESKSNQRKSLFELVIKQADFFERIFSYMKDVNRGSDFTPIIKLTDFIVQYFPEANLNIPHNDIKEVYTKIKSTFNNKDELNYVTLMLSRIEEYQPKKVICQRITAEPKKIIGQGITADQNFDNQKKVINPKKDNEQSKVNKTSERKFVEPNKSIVGQRKPVEDIGRRKPVEQKVPDQKKDVKEKPEWIIHHIENRVEMPIEPSPDEIFNLRGMMIRPTLTPHLASRSWSPEYEEIYRQIHYDLLRTEVVEDLQRASVSFFANNCKDYNIPMNSPFYNYVYYQDVRVVDTYIDKNFTPYVRVGFKPSRPVDWIKGEHLIYGTFVLLFKVKSESNNLSIDMSSMTWAMVGYFNLDDVIRPNSNKDSSWKSRESFELCYDKTNNGMAQRIRNPEIYSIVSTTVHMQSR